MMIRTLIFLLLSISLLKAQARDYGIKVGAKAPLFLTSDVEGNEVSLKKLLKRGKVVLVFYRGGWCPYCNLQLRKLQTDLLPTVRKVKGSIVAISVDRLKEGVKTQKTNKVGFIIVSDSKAQIIKQYNLDYNVSHLVDKYKSNYGIDIENASGNKSHIISVPSVLVIGVDGTVKYAYTNVDYTQRADISDVIKKMNE